MISVIRILLLATLSFFSVACSSHGEKKDINSDVSDLVMCEEPRPQVCTNEYNPVCANYNDGSKKTGSTGCTSCSDPEVVGYVMGVCKNIYMNNK